MVGVAGLEPAASWSRTKRDTKLRHTPATFVIIPTYLMFVKCYFQSAQCFTNCFSFRNWKSNRLTGVKKDKEKIQLLKEQGWNNQQSETVWLNAFADETQAKKYNNLKSGGASWADAMAVMDIGGDATEGLTEAQIKVYNQRWEKITGETTKKLMTTKAYKDADAEGREALVDKLNTYASAVAKAEATKKASKEAWVHD